MRRLSITLITLAVLTILSVSSGWCEGNVLFTLGGRQLDEDTQPLDEQGVFGVNLLHKKGCVAGLSLFRMGRFVGARLTGTNVQNGLIREEDDGAASLYAEGGIFWRLAKGFNIGLGARLLFWTEVEFAGEQVNVNDSQLHGVIGWGW